MNDLDRYVRDQLRDFRADVSEPDTADVARAYQAVLAGAARPTRRTQKLLAVPAFAALVGVMAAAVATAATVLVVTRGDRGPDPAAVIRGVLASKSSARWVLHSQVRQVLPTNGTRQCEMWSTSDGTGEFRAVTTAGNARIGAAGQYKPRRGYIVSPDGLAYVDDHVLDLAVPEMKSWAGDPRRLLAESPPSSWHVSESSLEGRPTYLLESKEKTEYGASAASFVVDRDSLAPIRAEVEVNVTRCGIPQLVNFNRGHGTTANYRYLQPTPTNLNLLRFRATGGVHPAAMLPNALADALGQRHVDAGDPGAAPTETSPSPGDQGDLNEP
jgi:hypothetical protein